MFLPGLLAHRSILAGGVPVDIPDLRDPAQRDLWRNDTACTDPEVAGDMLLPRSIQGDPPENKERDALMRRQWEAGKPGLRDGKIGYTQYIMPLREDHPYRKKEKH